MNFFAPISVYRAAYDNRGQVMPLAEFMKLGKEQYAAQIQQYRERKAKLTELVDYRTLLEETIADMTNEIEEKRNPLGGVDTPEVEELRTKLSIAITECEELRVKIDILDKECSKIKTQFPSASISGYFEPSRSKANLKQHSGFICIDIDDHYTINKKIYSQDLSDVPQMLDSLSWVVYAAHSVGGRGYFALIPIGPIDEVKTHEWYFDCLAEEFETFGIVIDPACRDTTRLRFCSMDDNPIRHKNCTVYMGRSNFVSREKRRELEQKRIELSNRPVYTDISEVKFRHVERCVELIEQNKLDITQDYKQCVNLGRAFYSLGDAGFDLWRRVCAFRSDAHTQMRTEWQLQHKWKSFAGTGSIDIGFFFNTCKEYNIYAKDR